MRRRDLLRMITLLAAGSKAKALLPFASTTNPSAPAFPGPALDYHGYTMHGFEVDGCKTHVVRPTEPLPGLPWVWRTMFWDAFPAADLALLKAGLHLAFVDVGNTFGCPDAMKHFDIFYAVMTNQYGLSPKPVIEGLSRGGLYAYRWAYINTGKVGCIYGDAPVCDMKSWPGGKGSGKGSPPDWQEAIKDYHLANEQQMMEFKGNPIDILAPIAAAHIPIVHVCGDADTVVPESENTDIVRKRYMALGGDFVLIVKLGCDHHPHGLKDPAPVVNFVLAHCAQGEVATKALALALKPGSITRLAAGQW